MIVSSTIEFIIESEVPIKFTCYPGVALRAALYEAFTQLYDTGQMVESSADVQANPLRWLFALETSQTSGSHTVPRPYIIRPPLELNGNELVFGVTLLGRAVELTQHVVSCVVAMQALGLGMEKQPFTLKAVKAVDMLRGEKRLLINATGEPKGMLFDPPTRQDVQQVATKFAGDTLEINFLTPTAIISQRRLCSKPEFLAFFQRLLERLLLLNAHFADEVEGILIDELLQQAKSIKCIRDETCFYGKQRSSRYSRNIVGTLGKVTFSGDFAKLIPFLIQGQLLNVGKNATKGCGWFTISSC